MNAPGESTSVVDRVLHVLARVARARRPMSAKQIASEVGAPLSTVYRLLNALKKWGLLQEHANSGLFEPGPTGVQLAWGYDQNALLISQSRDELQALVERTQESAGLMVPVADQVVCLAMLESDQPLRCSFTRGRAHPLLMGASAKALLAFLPEADAVQVVTRHANGNTALIATTLAQLREIREKRYAVSESEVDLGVWGVSAPIVSDNGRLEGTLSLMAPALRMRGREQEFALLTLAAADRISHRL